MTIKAPPVRVAIPYAGFGLECIINVNGQIKSEGKVLCVPYAMWAALTLRTSLYGADLPSLRRILTVQSSASSIAFSSGLVDIAMELREPPSGG